MDGSSRLYWLYTILRVELRSETSRTENDENKWMKIDVFNKSKVSAHIKLEQNTFRILNFKKLICMHLSPENVTETKEEQSIEMSIR